jgi:hypothetical protein
LLLIMRRVTAMAQPNKGERRQVKTRLPGSLHEHVAAYAEAEELTVSEALADLVAKALGQALPSETLPQPKTRRQREELPLAMSA